MKHVSTAPDGSNIFQITLHHAGLSATFLSIGACLQDLRLETHSNSLVLGHHDAEAYLSNPNYFGTTVGRFANRLANGQGVVDGKPVQVDRNTDLGHHLHGGCDGTSTQNWKVTEHSDRHVVFEIMLPDGHMGFAGNLHVFNTYRLLENHTIEIEISATTDATTLCSFCHHSYFNLTGNTDILDHRLSVSADDYLPVKSEGIPTGEIANVTGTKFDYRDGKELSRDTPLDHNFCLSKQRQAIRKVAVLSAPEQKLSMHISTTEPGLQVYMGQGISDGPLGHDNTQYKPFSGVALEPQLWPDGPNHPNFPSAVLKPNETYRQVSRFAFKQGYSP